jgi:hypothetical protein
VDIPDLICHMKWFEPVVLSGYIMRRQLRLGAACISLGMFVLFAIFWVRSYELYGVLPARNWKLDSWEGRISFVGGTNKIYINTNPLSGGSLNAYFIPADRHRDGMRRRWISSLLFVPPEPRNYFGFSAQVSGTEWRGSIPYWFLCLATAVIATLLKPKPRLQYSLHGLFLLTTILAVMLGGSLALTMSWFSVNWNS